MLLLFLLNSCAYRNIEGRVKPVYFSAQAAVFTDTLSPVQFVTYENVLGLSHPCLMAVDLQQGKEVSALIANAAIASCSY